MTADVKITYFNRSWNKDKPCIFVFARNMVPSFDVLKHGTAWKTIAGVGRRSSCCFAFPGKTFVQAVWDNDCMTELLEALPGSRFAVEEDDTGIVINPTGRASQPEAIEIVNLVQVRGGISARLLKAGSPLMIKNSVAFGQKAVFVLHPKLYWGIASEIQAGQVVGSAVLNTDRFWVQDIQDLEEAAVALVGNAKDGYNFILEKSENPS